MPVEVVRPQSTPASVRQVEMKAKTDVAVLGTKSLVKVARDVQVGRATEGRVSAML